MKRKAVADITGKVIYPNSSIKISEQSAPPIVEQKTDSPLPEAADICRYTWYKATDKPIKESARPYIRALMSCFQTPREKITTRGYIAIL